MTAPPTDERHPIRPRAANEGTHEWFLLASLAFAVLGGFTLAVALPVERALDRFDVGWLSHAQVHGHLQVMGFAGLFVIGVASRLGPRFAGSRIDEPAWLPAGSSSTSVDVLVIWMQKIRSAPASMISTAPVWGGSWPRLTSPPVVRSTIFIALRTVSGSLLRKLTPT